MLCAKSLRRHKVYNCRTVSPGRRREIHPRAKPPYNHPNHAPRWHSRYKRSETLRLLKGAIDAGLTVRGLETDLVTGALRVLVGKPDEPDGETVKDLIK